MEKVKVMYITPLFGKMGGSERNIYDIVGNIDRERFIPYLVCLQGGELVEEIKSKGICTKIITLKKIFSIEAVRKGIDLYKFIRGEGITVVVTYHHDADIWGGVVAMLAGTPVVISCRRDMGYQLGKKHIWTYRFLNRLYTKIITVSDAVKNVIVNYEWADPDNIITIHNGVKYSDFQSRLTKEEGVTLKKSFGIEPSDIVIGNFGTLRPVKGQLYLAQAIREIVKKQGNIKVLFVGFKDSGYFEEIQAVINEDGLSKYFIFTGDRRDIAEILSIIDIYVLSSISEGFPNAVLEAMAAGKPVIATNSGGSPEAVIHKKTGLLVPPCDSNALSDAIQRLIESKEMRQSMGLHGLNRVTTTFTLQKMLQTTEELYNYLALKNIKNSNMFTYRTNQTIKNFVKILLSYLLYYSGITSIFKRFRQKTPAILAYHSINQITLKPLEIEQEPVSFEQQIRYLKDHYKILSLSEFLEFKNNGGKYPSNSVLITLDDGYRDNYTNAYPVLRKYDVPAVFFLTVNPLETKEPLFFDVLRFAVIKTSRLILDLGDVGLSKYLLDKENEEATLMAIREITEYAKQLDGDSKAQLSKIIYTRLGFDVKEIKDAQSYLSWNEVNEMLKNGIEFGSHSMAHSRLTSLSFLECKEELVQSKKVIEERIGRRIRTLAYPFGGSKDYNGIVEKAAYEAGYECAFSLCYSGMMNGYTVGRRLVDSHTSTIFTGNFCKPLFATCLSGAYDRWGSRRDEDTSH